MKWKNSFDDALMLLLLLFVLNIVLQPISKTFSSANFGARRIKSSCIFSRKNNILYVSRWRPRRVDDDDDDEHFSPSKSYRIFSKSGPDLRGVGVPEYRSRTIHIPESGPCTTSIISIESCWFFSCNSQQRGQRIIIFQLNLSTQCVP